MNIAFVCLQAQQDDSIISHIIMGIMVFVVMYYLLVVRRKKLEAQEKSAEETFEYQQQPEISNPSSVKCPFCNNFINAELYGRVSHAVPWVMVFPNGGSEPRHPSQLYEAGCEGILLFLILNALWWFCPKYRRRTGFLSGLFLLLYALMRFGLEFFREPDFQLGFIFEQSVYLFFHRPDRK